MCSCTCECIVCCVCVCLCLCLWLGISIYHATCIHIIIASVPFNCHVRTTPHTHILTPIKLTLSSNLENIFLTQLNCLKTQSKCSLCHSFSSKVLANYNCQTSDICQVNFSECQIKMLDHFCIVSNHAKLKFSSHSHYVSPAADSYN